MTYGEWCPQCGGEIVSVTRGIPSMGKCKLGHMTDRRDVHRRKPENEIDMLRATNIELTRQIAILQARLKALKPVTDHVDAMEAQIRADFEAECG